MTMPRIALAPVLAVLLCVTLPGTALSGDGNPWSDAMGREVTLSLPAERVVSLAPSATEILFAIGAGGLVTGVSKHCDYPLEAKLKPKVGDFNGPEIDAVKAARPQVVLFTEYARQEDLDALEKAGIASLVLAAGTVHEIIDSVRLLGEITGRTAEAESLAEELEEEIAALRRITGGIPDEKRPRVYVEVDGPKSLYAVGPGSFMDDLVAIAGGRNVFAGREAPYFPVEHGEVIAADPDVIFIDYPFQYKVGLTKRPGWDKVAAVREGRVYDGTDFDIILMNRPGPRIVQSLGEIARLLHPERFHEK
jgi:iron complex transport system substrate-binding protein